MNKYLPLTITLLAIFLANATAKAGVFKSVATASVAFHVIR